MKDEALGQNADIGVHRFEVVVRLISSLHGLGLIHGNSNQYLHVEKKHVYHSFGRGDKQAHP